MSEAEVVSLMDRARRSLRSAHNILDDGDHDFAVSRAYFAMFYAASATLRSQGVRRSKHSGVIAAFGQHMVKTGRFPVEQHVALQAAFSSRGAGDYGGVFPDREEAERRLQEAEEFVAAVADFLTAEGLNF